MSAFPEDEQLLAGVLVQISDHDTDHDTDYAVRYGLVLDALARAHRLGYPAGISWDTSLDPAVDGFRAVAYIELPTGQVSWHMPEHPQAWDGHSTGEKHARIRAYGAGADMAVAPPRRRGLPTFAAMRQNALRLLGDAQAELRSDWRDGTGPTRGQAAAVRAAMTAIGRATAALDRAAQR